MRSALWVAGLSLAMGCTKEASKDKEHVDTDSGTTADTEDTDETPLQAGSDQRIDDAGDTATDSEKVRLCALSSGAVVVIWVDDRNGDRAIWSRSSPDGGQTWDDPAVQVNDGTNGADNPQLACQGNTAYAAWEDNRDSETEDANIYVSSSTGGGAWAANTLVGGTDIGVFEHLEPQIAAVGDEVHVVWHSDDNGAFDIYVASSTDRGSSFGDPVRVESDVPGTAWSSNASVAADGLGRVFVAWEDRRLGVGDVFVATSTNSGVSFGGDMRLDSGVGDSYRPTIAAAAGEAWVGWYDERDGEKLEVYAAYSDNGGGSWAPAIRVSEGEPGERDSVLPRMILDAGTLHMVWFQGGGGGYHTEYRQLAAGAVSTDIVQLDHAPSAARTTYPALIPSDGGWLVAWRDDRASGEDDLNDLYYSVSSNNGASWSPTDLRIDAHEAGSTYAIDHSVAVADGALLAAWSDGRRGDADVFFTRLVLGEEATQ